MSDDEFYERDSYKCSGGCGCGVCVPKGQTPNPDEHWIYNPKTKGQKLCGTYSIFEGQCEACLREKERMANDN